MSIMPAFTTRRTNYNYGPSSYDAWDHFNDEYNPQTAKVAEYQGPLYYSHDDHQHRQYPPPHRVPIPYSHQHHQHQTTSFANARVEWKETPEAYFVRVELPAGVKREDVRVFLEDDKLLKISGERQREDKNENWHRVERREKFLTAFMLPEDSRADEVASSTANGVLTITVPKRQVKHHTRPLEMIL